MITPQLLLRLKIDPGYPPLPQGAAKLAGFCARLYWLILIVTASVSSLQAQDWGGADSPQPPELTIMSGVTVFHPGSLEDEGFQLFPRQEIGASLFLTQNVSSVFGYEVILERDPLLMNRLIPRVTVNINPFTLILGPALGLFYGDPENLLNPGLSVSLRFTIRSDIFPQVSFYAIEFRFDTSLQRNLKEGEYLQDLQELKATASTGPLSFIFTINNRELIWQTPESIETRGRWIRYNFTGRYDPFYLGSVPLALGLTAGYQELFYEYHIGIQGARYQYPTAYVGLEGSVGLGPTLDLLFSGDLPIYPLDYWTDPQQPSFFNANLGIRLTF